jgi:hypothetical protein
VTRAHCRRLSTHPPARPALPCPALPWSRARQQPGDQVRVINGSHAGERGMVVSIQGSQAVVLSNSRQTELKVFVRDLTEDKDSSTGAGRAACARVCAWCATVLPRWWWWWWWWW